MNLNYFLLDVFTSHQFGGNPLAVFPDADHITTRQMQSIAGELNLSETTFIQRATSDGSDCTVRIFTPKHEVPMAGHPTIGTAAVILKNKLINPCHGNHLVFDEGVGPVQVDFTITGGLPGGLVMHQPMPEFSETLDKSVVAEILSLASTDIEESCPVQLVSCGLPVVIVPLKSLDAARRATIRLDLLQTKLADIDCREFFVFTREAESPEADVHCRFFAPRLGVVEDPATGGAHGPLGSYLVKYGMSDGKQITSEQGMEMGRPSTIQVRIESHDDQITDVLVGGECVEVGEGKIRLDC